MSEKEKGGGPYVPEAQRGIKTLACRIHLHEYAAFRRLLFRDKLSVQGFLSACIESYLAGNRNVLKEGLPSRPPSGQEAILSRQERNDIFRQIEHSSADQEDF